MSSAEWHLSNTEKCVRVCPLLFAVHGVLSVGTLAHHFPRAKSTPKAQYKKLRPPIMRSEDNREVGLKLHVRPLQILPLYLGLNL